MARTEGVPGGNLWKLDGTTEGYCDHPGLKGLHMTKTRHNQIMDCVSYLWADEGKEWLDDWWQIINLPTLFAAFWVPSAAVNLKVVTTN